MNLKKIKSDIKGPVFPIITPFTKKHGVDYKKVREYIDFLYQGGARIFHVMVHSSRIGLLSEKEIIKLNKTVTNHTKSKYKDCIVIASGPIIGSTRLNIKIAEEAEKAGADIIGIIFSERYYFKDQIVKYYKEIATRVKIGILIHEEQLNSIHGTKKAQFPLDVLDKIAGIKNVVAIKEDSKNHEFSLKTIKLLKERLAIIVSGAAKKQFLASAPYGCHAYLVGVGNFAPLVATQFYKYYLEGNLEMCNEIINEIETPFLQIAKELGWHIGLKSAMEITRVMNRDERPPLEKLSLTQHKKIESVLKQIQNKSIWKKVNKQK
ncbi:MAG: dihydrodipicolinate synthase family protein [Patescibacteria group bacterium]|nr:dihydrodipicolinate synthase family protein [Patescibacteria group bacterium]